MPIIGIDLGTTNSLVCTLQEDQPQLIPNASGKLLTPSVISVDEDSGNILIGQAAKDRLITHPQLSIETFKRFMGSAGQHRLGKKRFSSTELSALILKQLKADAEAFLGETVTEAVISVPAYFSDAQRKATKQAGEIAGLKVERLINEPTAAALAYGMHEKVDEQLFIIVDLGGGTLDVSILDVFDDIVQVKASAGNNFFGGEDFTKALLEFFARQNDVRLEQLNRNDMSRLKGSIEHLKHQLSESPSVEFKITLKETAYEWICERSEFEREITDLLNNFRKPIERALKDSKVSPSELDNVILVGGASRMPWIRAEVAKLFRRLPAVHLNPDEVIAQGTAIQAGLKSRNEAFKDVVLTDVCPFTLGIDIAISKGKNQHESGHFSPIIERNMTIPVSRAERYHTLSDNQSTIQFDVYQGESRLVKNNIRIGSLSLDVPPAKAGEEYVDVRFTYDINGILEVIATSGSTQASSSTIINNNAQSLSEDEIKASLKKLAELKIHPRDDLKNRELMALLERLYEEHLGAERDYIGHLLRQFEAVMESQDKTAVEATRIELEAAVKQFEKGVF